MNRVALAILLIAFLLPLGGCTSNPTPASSLSPEDEKKFEEELRKKAQSEGGQKKSTSTDSGH